MESDHLCHSWGEIANNRVMNGMTIEVINTGTELLLGDTINTNAAWLGQRLAALGLTVSRQTVVPDGGAILEAMAEAAARADIVIATGGLGPTNDDVTRDAVAALLGVPMEMNGHVLQALDDYFSRRGKPVTEATKRQAMVPLGGKILCNPHGTAPGLYIPASVGAVKGVNCHFFLTPGPPREFKPMIENMVEPRLKELIPSLADRSVLYLKVTGVGESDIVEKVEKQLEAVPGLDLGYCIGKGDVDVRLAGTTAAVRAGREIVMTAMQDFVLSEDRRVIEQVVVDLLTAAKRQVSVAESCTGGMICSRITDVPGSSTVFTHGFVTYANEAKSQLLGVPDALISQYGAVSAEVAVAMAEGCCKVSGADYALAVTGIAGPGGGSDLKPVGTVFLGLAESGKRTEVRRLFFPNGRDRFKLLTSQWALDMLRRRIEGYPIPL